MENELIKILYLDDEIAALFNFEQLFHDDFEVHTAASAAQGMEILATSEIQIVISDQRMPNKTGIEFLAEVAQLYPDTVRILLTAYSEAEVIIDAINQGQVYQYITKPFETKNLKNILDKASQNWLLKRENQLLITQLQKKNAEYEAINEELRQNNEELCTSNKIIEESKKQTERILETAMDGFWMVNMNGQLMDANEAYCQMSGFTRDELLTMKVSDLEAIENDDDVRGRINKVITVGEDRFETKHRTKAGKVYDVEISLKFQANENGCFVLFIRDITEQKMAKNALLEAEWKFKALFEFGPIGVAYHRMIYDESGEPFDYHFIDANASYNELTGVSPKGMTVRQAFPGIENDPADWIGKFGHVAKTGETIRFEQYLESNGRWYDVVGYQYKPDHFVAAFNEITKRKEAEIALKEREEDLRNLIELSPVAMVIIHDWRTVYFNPSAVQLFGANNESELVNRPILDFIHTDCQELASENSKLLVETGVVPIQEQKFLKIDGSVLDVESQAKTIQFNGERATLVVINNITDRKKAEQALKTEKTRLSLIIEGTNAATWEWNIQTGETIFNERWAEMIGYKLDEIMPVSIKTWEEYCHPDDFIKAYELINKHFAGEIDYYEIETRMRHKNGNWVWVLDRGRVHTWTEDGKPLLMAGTHQDITERKQAELLLENERALYLDLVNTQPAGIYRIRVLPKENWENDAWKNAQTPPFKMELISNRFCEILDINQQTFESNPGIIIDLVHPDDKEEFVRRNEEANTLISNFSWDCRLVINNNIKWIHFESLPRKLENGDILFTGIIYDITEQKQAQEALIENNLRLELAMQAAKMAWWEMEIPSGNVVFNKRKAEMLGYSPENFKHYSDFMSLVHPEDSEKVMDAMRNHIYGTVKAYETEYRILTNSGEYKWFYDIGSVVERDATGKRLKISGLVLDITERKQAEEASRKSEERYSSLLQYLETGIVVHAPDSAIITSNPRASELLGLTFEQMQGKVAMDPDWNFVNVDNIKMLVENYPVQQIINTKKAIKDQILGIQKTANDTIIWVNINGFPVLNNDGEITEIVISFFDITDRKIAEKKLQENYNLLDNLTAQVPGVVYQFRLNPDGSSAFPYSSEGMYEIYEVTSDEVREDASLVFTRIHPDDYDFIVETITDSALNQTSYHSEFRVILPEQGLRWRHCNAKPELLEDGSTLWHGIIIDITERKKAEKELARNTQLLEESQSIAKVGGWEFDVLTGMLYWSAETYRIHDTSPQEFNPTVEAGVSYFLPKSKQIITDALELAINQGIGYDLELETFTTKGRKIDVKTTCKCTIENGKTIKLTGIFQDITQQKLDEKNLKNSQKLLSETEKIGNVGGWEYYYDSGIMNWTEETYNIHELQYAKNVSLDAGINFYTPEAIPIINNAVQQAIEFSIPFDLELDIITVKGNIRTVHTIGKCDPDNQRIYGFFQDITERKKAEKDLFEKNKEMENLIYVASHDLRSPLVNIQGFSLRLENQTSEIVKRVHQLQLEKEIQDVIDKLSTVEIPKSVGFIMSNISKMDNLINGLLKLSRTGRILMNISEINMNTLFQSIINIHQFELSELDAIVEIDSLTNCYGDENQLNQLFSNIIANAIKYRDLNRRLSLKINSKTHSNKVVYAITDNGIGINNKYLPKIWDIFYRVNPTKTETGEGLGLSVARKITEKHKGKIWVESEPGVGSTFYVELLQNKFEE